jgi:hypothetical protein
MKVSHGTAGIVALAAGHPIVRRWQIVEAGL